MSEFTDKFTLHRERRLSELHQRMKNSKLHSSKKYKYWILNMKMGKMRYQYNRGKTCQEDGCKNKARIKGYCIHCYNLKRRYAENKIKRENLNILKKI